MLAGVYNQAHQQRFKKVLPDTPSRVRRERGISLGLRLENRFRFVI
jgi:hypothetical protein